MRGEPGELKNHVQRGSTEPAVAWAAYSPSAFIDASPIVVTLVKPAGPPRPTTPFDIVTAYASPPARTGIAPGPATVVVVSEPEADRDVSTASANVAATPLQAEIMAPPSTTDDESVARTSRRVLKSGFGSGKFCTFVATYVAIEMPPAWTYWTSV